MLNAFTTNPDGSAQLRIKRQGPKQVLEGSARTCKPWLTMVRTDRKITHGVKNASRRLVRIWNFIGRASLDAPPRIHRAIFEIEQRLRR
jgi:hypothetical protein